jgi:hypothetical protein
MVGLFPQKAIFQKRFCKRVDKNNPETHEGYKEDYGKHN